MIEYCIAKKEHFVQTVELYKQLIPDEHPISIDEANIIRDKAKNN